MRKINRIIKHPYFTLFAICLGWMLSLITFQWFAEARLVDLVRPDYAVSWSENETTQRGGSGRVANDYLHDPFMNRHVAWDSEFYLSIATVGYDDPEVRGVPVGGVREIIVGSFRFYQRYNVTNEVTLNHAFFPLYPWLMRLLSIPLSILGMTDIATATLAGLIISGLGALAGMIALYDITKERLGERGALRTAFYLLIFPSSMFMAQVYTEGLFVGLAFGAIALARRKKLFWAAVLASLAAWTRAVGVVLFIPLVGRWIIDEQWTDIDVEWREIYYNGLPWRGIGAFLIRFSPIIAHLAWRFSPLGFGSQVVQTNFFGRGFLMFGTSLEFWIDAAKTMFQENTQTTVYYLVEFGASAVALWACFAVRKRYPTIALYSVVAVIIAMTSGVPQGMHRYMLAAPALFIWLGEKGENPIFDRTYAIFSGLLMALYALTFTFDFWTG